MLDATWGSIEQRLLPHLARMGQFYAIRQHLARLLKELYYQLLEGSALKSRSYEPSEDLIQTTYDRIMSRSEIMLAMMQCLADEHFTEPAAFMSCVPTITPAVSITDRLAA